MVAIGGRNVLKVVSVRGYEYGDQQLKEEKNLRGRGSDAKTHANDVEFNPHEMSQHILAAGYIYIYMYEYTYIPPHTLSFII